MTTTETRAIFWGTSWASATYPGDKITGLDAFYTGFSNSNYAKTGTEYSGSNGQAGSVSTYKGHLIDSATTAADGSNTNLILAEVCKLIVANGITPNANQYYAVYTDVKRGSQQYCGYHSGGTCPSSLAPSVVVQFAFFFDLANDNGCDSSDTSGLHSQPLSALASVSAHEIMEMITDPAQAVNGGWWDAYGNENGDKCAWSFGSPLVTFSDGTKWKLQGEWSNGAYLNPSAYPTSYPNLSNQKGCLSGL